MTLLQAIVFGAVQGVTEFLPISSTAHLILLPWFMGWKEPGQSFDIALHLGTLVALLLFFRKEWVQITRAGLNLFRGQTSDPQGWLALFIVLATIPGALAGALFEHKVEEALRNPLVISFTLIALAIVLAVAEKRGRRETSIERISLADAMTVGFAQALSIIPGVSRSGVTITAGLFRGLKREAAARFSFFLSAPIITGAVGKKLFDIARDGLPPGIEATTFAAGIITSGIVGYASIAFLLRYLATRDSFIFVYYRIALGIVVLLAFWSGFR